MFKNGVYTEPKPVYTKPEPVYTKPIEPIKAVYTEGPKQVDMQRGPSMIVSPLNGAVTLTHPGWAPGQSGNPEGLSRRKREVAEFQDYIKTHPGDWEAIIAKGFEKAKDGDHAFWTSVVERIKGKVPQKMEGGPVVAELKIVYNILNVEQRDKIEASHTTMDDL